MARSFVHSLKLPASRRLPPRRSWDAEVVIMQAKDVLGQRGEQAAAEYLTAAGFRILARNWRCAEGEIDIVAVERHTLVVCEVKTRSTGQRGTPLESVSRIKRNRLRRLAIRWLTANGVRFDQVRVDIVGVQPGPDGGLAVEHVRGVG